MIQHHLVLTTFLWPLELSLHVCFLTIFFAFQCTIPLFMTNLLYNSCISDQCSKFILYHIYNISTVYYYGIDFLSLLNKNLLYFTFSDLLTKKDLFIYFLPICHRHVMLERLSPLSLLWDFIVPFFHYFFR